MNTRLKTRQEYRRVSIQGKKKYGKYIAIELLPSPNSPSRLGITVTKKFGKAHDRNRFKRIVRASWREVHTAYPTGFDINVRPKANDAISSSMVKEELLYLIKKTLDV